MQSNKIRLDKFHIVLMRQDQAEAENLGLLLSNSSGATCIKFNERVIATVIALANLNRAQWDQWYSEDKGRQRSELFGHSCDAILSIVSKKMISPVLGNQFLGTTAASNAVYHSSGTIYLDGQTEDELDSILRFHPSNRIIVVQSASSDESRSCVDLRGKYPEISFLSVDFSSPAFLDLLLVEMDKKLDVLRGAI